MNRVEREGFLGGGGGVTEKTMKRTAQVGLTMALLIGGATLALAQNGPPNLYNAYDNYAASCHGRFYNLAPYYWPGDYPGAPAYRYLACWGYYPGAYQYWGWR